MGGPVLVVLLIAATAIAVPPRLPLHRAQPATAAGVLLLALLVRALLMVALRLSCGCRRFRVAGALSWCWHELLPDLRRALGFAGIRFLTQRWPRRWRRGGVRRREVALGQLRNPNPASGRRLAAGYLPRIKGGV